jgi:hypothetical protein
MSLPASLLLSLSLGLPCFETPFDIVKVIAYIGKHFYAIQEHIIYELVKVFISS